MLTRFTTAMIVASSLGVLPASISSVSAADLPLRQPTPMSQAPFAPAPVPPAYNWSGLYLGAHVGYGWSDFEFRNPATTANVPGLSPPGGLTAGLPLFRTFEGESVLGGAQLGFNAQWGNLVVGVEGDVGWTGMSGSVRSTAGPFTLLGLGPVTTAEGASADLDFLATVRGRLGVSFNNFLFYGTGGVAVGRVESAGDVTAFLGPEFATLAARGRETHVGWTAGAGVEALLAPNLSAKVEYLYADLGWERHRAPGVVTASPVAASLIPPGSSAEASGEFKIEVHSIKVGLNYRFP